MNSINKYGVIWSPTNNIGDDIQTFAAKNFLNKKGVKDFIFLNREKLHEYDGDHVNVLMNGWFLNKKENFPPSSSINPIFISFHLQDDVRRHVVKHNVKYFKKYEPIGCRDSATAKMLQDYGVDAYLTGCLTMYLDPQPIKGGGKYLIDINNPNSWGLRNSLITSADFPEAKFDDKFLIRNKVPGFEIMTCHNNHLLHKTPQQRLEEGEKYAQIYSKADLVITSRLHVALPCRAFGTKCVFVHPKYDLDSRFSGLRSVLNGLQRIDKKRTKGLQESLDKFLHFFNEYQL